MERATVMAALLLLGAAGDDGTTQLLERAYAHNRDGMIAMSKARFNDAIEQFQHAAGLVPDYGITRRGLHYTPNFMTGWAYEKLGRSDAACRFFRRFLDLAPAQWLEADKADHANGFMAHHCPAMHERPIPDEDRSL